MPIEAPLILRLDPEQPDPVSIQTAAGSIRSGRVIVFPTQCLYGLGVDADNGEAVARIFRIKERPAEKPLLLLIPDRGWLRHLTDEVPTLAERLMKAYWPGNLTLIFKTSARVPDPLTAGTGKIGIRLPGHPVARKLVQAVGGPITGTSANLSGSPGCRDLRDIPAALLRQVDLALDAGPLRGGVGSTVVDVTVTPPLILRAGIIRPEHIQSAIDS